ncbi:thioredoxin-like domain-containing protein [Saprospiraceae bacterium]|nr:thioredoxin-like domain-containing protein [Saprospiraceae bacterium]
MLSHSISEPSTKISTDGYNINIKLNTYKNRPLTLAHYFGEVFQVDTTIMTDENGEVIFKGTKKLQKGIYVIIMEGHEHYIDFIIGNDQYFSIAVEFNEYDHSEKVKFINSAENDLLTEYKGFMQKMENDINIANEKLIAATNHNDSSTYIHELSMIDMEIQEYRSSLITKHTDSFVSTLLRALQEPILPAHLKNPGNAADSITAKNYIKKHFWDGVNFWDESLAYTPFFSPKLDKYFSEIVEWNSDSVIQQIDWMMSTAVANKDMEKLILGKLLYGSMTHDYKWEASVFIHLFENYIASKSYPWLNPELKKTLTDHAFLLMGNTKGALAEDINLPSLNGSLKSLYDIDSKYTLLCFWDTSCDHCVETLPLMDSIYQSKWIDEDIKIYTVSVQTAGTQKDWSNYIQSNHLENWTNVYHSLEEEIGMAEKGLPSTLQKFNVWYYPSFFLLDNKKNFLAKKLNYQQVVELMESIIKKNP